MTRRPYDETQIGGKGNVFLTTHWSLIEGMREEEDKDKALIASLLESYWKPVYCYVRYQGHANEDAKDLTQGFFHEVVLERNLVERADQAKGRFRTFLLHALNQYLLNVREKGQAKKRIPKGKLVSLDHADLPELPHDVAESSPEEAFNYAWLSALLDRVMAEVRKDCLAKGLDSHWQVFHDRVAEPILNSNSPPSLADICQRHGIADSAKASSMIQTVKRRFQSILKHHVRTTVISEGSVPDEIQEILRFAKNGSLD